MDQELLNRAVALAARGYQVQVQKEDAQDGTLVWVAYVPEMPSCVAQGDSPVRAKEALKIVREDYIYFRLKRGVPVPDPKPMPSDATLEIASYSRPRQNPSRSQSDAVGDGLQPADQSYAYTCQPAAAFINQTVKQPIR